MYYSGEPGNLTRREQQVFGLLIEGNSNKQIAFALRISPKTVEEHLTNIYRKIGATSRLAAVLWSIAQTGDFPH